MHPPAAELIQTSFYGTVIDHYLDGAKASALAPSSRVDFRRNCCVAVCCLFRWDQLGIF
jgi:hypothetical protein